MNKTRKNLKISYFWPLFFVIEGSFYRCHKTFLSIMSNIFYKLPTEFAQKLRSMIAANKPAKHIYDFIFSMSGEQARNLGFSSTELYDAIIAVRSRSTAGTLTDEKTPTSRAANSTALKDGTGALPSTRSEDFSSESSDEADSSPGLDLEFASIGVPELQGYDS